MATIILGQAIKDNMYSAMRDRLTHIGLAMSGNNPAETSTNHPTTAGFLAGAKEIHQLRWNAVVKNKTHNNLLNTPILVFTVANDETPSFYHLFKKDGSVYYRDVVIDSGLSKATYDTAVHLRYVEITIKGNGE